MNIFDFKRTKNDFIVKEVINDKLTWKWEFIYILIKKRWKTTFEIIDFIWSNIWVDKKNIGIAWLKDKDWITYQWFSIHKKDIKYKDKEKCIRKWLNKFCKIIKIEYNDKPLKIWQNLWNNFEINLYKNKKIELDKLKNAIQKAFEILKNNWFPNYYWVQRFWKWNLKWFIGKWIIKSEVKTKFMSKREKKIKIQSFSSYLFNCYLKLREHRRILNNKIDWDIIIDNICTWPVYWFDMKFATDKALSLEIQILKDAWLTINDLQKFWEYWVFGFRRKLICIPQNLTYEINDNWDINMKFFLESWVYASSMYNHFEKLVYNLLK